MLPDLSPLRRLGKGLAVVAACQLMALAWAGAAAADPRCPPAQAPAAVDVAVEEGAIHYHPGYDEADLMRLHGRNGRMAGAHGWRIGGLTLSRFKFDLNTQVRIQRLDRRLYCVRIDSVRAAIGYDALDVYISERYRRGSCEFKAVLDHEHRHVAVFRNVLVSYAQQVRNALDRAARDHGTMVMASKGNAAEAMQERLQQAVKPVLREMHRIEQSENAKLDSPESYRRDQAGCANW
jgi:hypothetical protein